MTEKERMLFNDKIQDIDKSFIKDGWITVYLNKHKECDQLYIFCCIVDSTRIKTYKLKTDWGIHPGHEGKPTIWSSFKKGKQVDKYHTYSEKGIEPFLFSKSFRFDGGNEKYVDISEEFVLYFKLYERGESKQNRTFFFIDDSGDLNEVIKINPSEIKVKLKYLMEYLAVRKYHLSVCFDFIRFSTLSIAELGINEQNENFTSNNHCYNFGIRPFMFINGYKVQSWMLGKTIVSPYPKGIKKLHFHIGNEQYEKFITGYDDEGNEIFQDCSNEDGKCLILTYFKKEVLSKYYNEPTKYIIDGMSLKSAFFTLKIDNNLEDVVAVFLIELRMLPNKEQLHWKQFNIPPQNIVSNVYYETMIQGNWAQHPEVPDLYFKYKYEDFNKKWEKKFGWKFYKPLDEKSVYRFTSLHIPTTNNIKSFCEQMLSLVIITIDSINEKEIGKDLILGKDERGISKLEKFLNSNQANMPDMFNFLRSLQDLRSGLVAHRFSNSNKKAMSAIAYFELKDDNYIEVAKEIFIKSIYTLNSLEKHFNLK